MKHICVLIISLLSLSMVSAAELQPAPVDGRFTFHQKYEPMGDGTSVVWLEFLLPDGKVVWVPRYRVGTVKVKS